MAPSPRLTDYALATDKPNFSSDNVAGVHPRVLEALAAANQGPAPAYGADPWTARATRRFHDLLDVEAGVYFVYGGTGANVLALHALARPHHAIICPASAHIAVDECGAPERYTGCKLLTVNTPNGKLTPAMLDTIARAPTSQHGSIPRVVSISQQTECGTLYTIDELHALVATAHAHGWRVHLDGARLANAVAASDLPLSTWIRDTGVDVVVFGGTKNGLIFGEAVLFLDRTLDYEFPNIRKQGMQLPSKMRFIAAQFDALLTDDLWIANARHANRMARTLADGLRALPACRLKWPVDGNALFPILPPEALRRLQEKFHFETWNEDESLARWMTSWATTAEDVEHFLAAIHTELG